MNNNNPDEEEYSVTYDIVEALAYMIMGIIALCAVITLVGVVLLAFLSLLNGISILITGSQLIQIW